MELEQVLKIADGEYATPAKRSEAARTLAAEVRRLQALAYPPQDGTEFAKIAYKDQYEAVLALASENDQRIGELQAENARLREASVLDTYEACDHNPPAPARRWSSCGTWLYPGESVVVLHAEAAEKGVGR